MSTKIFNTYLFAGSKEELLGFIKSHVGDDNTIFRQSLLSTMYMYSVKGYLNDVLTKSKGSVEKLGILLNNLELDFFASPKEFSKEFAGKFEQSLILYDTSKTKVKDKQLIQLFVTRGSKLTLDIQKNKKFRNFDYTNSTDMDIKKSEENLRRKTWDIVFKDSYVPSIAGETYELYSFISDYLENPKNIKLEIKKSLQSLYSNFKSEKHLEIIFDVIEINLRCQEIRRLRKNENKINDSEDYGSVSEYMSINRQANEEKKKGFVLKIEQEKLLNEIKNVAKFLPEDLPNFVIESEFKRLDLVVDETIKGNQKMIESLSENSLEKLVPKPILKL